MCEGFGKHCNRGRYAEIERFIRSPKEHHHWFSAKGGNITETAKFVKRSCTTMVKVCHARQNGTVQNQWRGKCGAPWAIDERGE
ncbi:hypothetical protein TNCV_1647721 [Trichonephila clavipes]|uniref:Uncharacterized protein n=1 Tax=Trichonephila clavipes TaxID=2585209 RepID=A0A8X6V6H6_TRICX|nr:hypothetical protein TNCV_1647721 [Trichonephila clavipes]